MLWTVFRCCQTCQTDLHALILITSPRLHFFSQCHTRNGHTHYTSECYIMCNVSKGSNEGHQRLWYLIKLYSSALTARSNQIFIRTCSESYYSARYCNSRQGSHYYCQRHHVSLICNSNSREGARQYLQANQMFSISTMGEPGWWKVNRFGWNLCHRPHGCYVIVMTKAAVDVGYKTKLHSWSSLYFIHSYTDCDYECVSWKNLWYIFS